MNNSYWVFLTARNPFSLYYDNLICTFFFFTPNNYVRDHNSCLASQSNRSYYKALGFFIWTYRSLSRVTSLFFNLNFLFLGPRYIWSMGALQQDTRYFTVLYRVERLDKLQIKNIRFIEWQNKINTSIDFSKTAVIFIFDLLRSSGGAWVLHHRVDTFKILVIFL